MAEDINSLIDLAFLGSNSEEQFDYEYFRLIYCNPKVRFTKMPGNILCVINSYPKGEYKDKTAKFLKSLKYSDFLETSYWGAVSAFILDVFSSKCTACGSGRFPNVHHKTYDHLGEEIFFLSDLTCLCFVCHNKFHGK